MQLEFLNLIGIGHSNNAKKFSKQIDFDRKFCTPLKFYHFDGGKKQKILQPKIKFVIALNLQTLEIFKDFFL